MKLFKKLFFPICFFSLSALATPTVLQKLEKKVAYLKQEITRMEKMAALGSARGIVSVPETCEGRLTLQSGVPFSSSDQTSKSTLYFTTNQGSTIGLYDGSAWSLVRFTEMSLALSGLTSGANYDVFVYNNAGTPALELSTVWTDDTTRADALALQNGVYVKSGATTRRYVGTIRTTGTTTTEDSHSKRFVWNYYNRALRYQYVNETTNSWTYATDAWRAANASSSNRVEFVIGINEALVVGEVMALVLGSTTSINYIATGIGVDSSTANSAKVFGSSADSGATLQVWATYEGYPGIGYHYLQWVERGNTSSVTFYGTNGDTTRYGSGLSSFFEG